MLSRLLNKLLNYKILIIRSSDIMNLSMLFASRIILGKMEFHEVPSKLKSKVAEILIDAGCEELIDEEEFLPQE